ncbi:MAG: PAS domain S-box protein, partial [Halorhabdus sp.]
PVIAAVREAADGDPIEELLEGDRSEYCGQIEADFPDHGRAVVEYEFAPLEADGEIESIVGTLRDRTAQKDRKQTLKRFEAAAENAGHAVYFTDRGGTIEYVNPAFERITGYDAEDVIGENPRILKSGEMDDEYYDELWETLRSGHVWEEEVVNQRRNGERYTAHQTIAPITENGDEITGFVAIQSDITDQRERERQLERTIETYEHLFHGVGDAVFVVEPVGQFLAVNDTACERLGYERAALLEMEPADIDLEHTHQRVAAVHGRIEAEGACTFETVHVTASGERIPVEITASSIEYFGTDAILSVVRDITDRVERERELERSRDLLAHSQRLADIAAWEYDVTAGTVRTTGRQQRTFGLETGMELDLATALDVYHPADRDRIETALDRASTHGVGFDYRLRIVPDDERRWVRVVGEPEIDDEEITAVRGAIRDITAEYRRRKELEANERALRDLHEVVVDDDRSFEEQIEALLEIGRQRTGLSAGYLTEVESEIVEVTQLVGDPDALDVGRRFPLSETFCRKVIENEAVFSIHDAAGQGYDDDPGYEQFGVEAYIGAPFFVEGELRGTLCFVDQTARTEPFSAMERTFVRNLVQQVGALFARRHRRTQLQTLHEATRSLFEATTPDDIPSMTTEAVEAITDAFALAFYRWDDETGDLQRVAQTTANEQDSDAFEQSIGPGDGPVWDAFVQEGQSFETLITGGDAPDTAPQILATPVDDIGVLAIRPRQGVERLAFERTFLETLARNVAVAFDTLEQTETLQEYAARLERQNDHLERLQRINAIIRDIQQTIVEATTRSEVEDAVCRNLTSIEHWELAWIGAPAVTDSGFTVRAMSDDRAESLATIETADGSIAAQALEGEHIVEVANIVSTEKSGRWRRTALELGYQAAIAIPISYGTREYGVLEIYADQPGTFTEEERHVLAELGTTIAYAITSLEQSQTLQSGGGVELELTVPPAEEFLLGLSDTLEGELTITNVVQRTDGNYLAYAMAADAGTVAETLSTDPLVERATTFGTDDPEQIELEFRESHLLEVLDAYDARVHRLDATPQTNRLTVFFPRTDTVRKFVEHLEDSYPDATLQAQRTVEADRTTSLAGALESLTDRQREILTIAYRRGFFEWPRASSGEEIADAIDIAPATFHQHIRTVQQNVLESLFESAT